MKKILSIFLCLVLLGCVALAEPVAEEPSTVGEKLGFTLLKELYAGGGNVMLSPASLALALGMAAVILAFEYWADDIVINLVYKVAGYTYGPILGMFAFGMFTRCKVRDRWIPLVAVAAPVLSALVQWWAREAWDYRIGFELLIYNAAFTMIGMSLLVERDEK